MPTRIGSHRMTTTFVHMRSRKQRMRTATATYSTTMVPEHRTTSLVLRGPEQPRRNTHTTNKKYFVSQLAPPSQRQRTPRLPGCLTGPPISCAALRHQARALCPRHAGEQGDPQAASARGRHSCLQHCASGQFADLRYNVS